jgi:hypothetical protein
LSAALPALLGLLAGICCDRFKIRGKRTRRCGCIVGGRGLEHGGRRLERLLRGIDPKRHATPRPAVFVLLSATSLSRALTRAMASIWRLSRPKTQLTNAWRWLAVVLALLMAIVVTSALSRFTDPIPPRNVWILVLTFGLDILVAAFMPWLLLANRVRVRRLIPGGVVLALAMLVVRPASEAYLPRASEESADQYGSNGVAFTYLDAGRQVPTATAMPRPSMVKPVAACMKR